jgi:hypothetical protein
MENPKLKMIINNKKINQLLPLRKNIFLLKVLLDRIKMSIFLLKRKIRDHRKSCFKECPKNKNYSITN